MNHDNTTDLIVKYKIRINGQTYEVDKPSISGHEILALADKSPAPDFVIYLKLEDGDMESIRLNEGVDLNRAGIEEFRIFKSDVIYRIEVNGQPREWAAPHITGKAIKKMVSGTPDDVGLWQEVKGEDERLIEDDDQIDLTASGIERFQTGHKYSICIEGKTYPWPKRKITAEEIATLGGWTFSDGVVEIQRDQSERTLTAGEVIKLEPGMNFCRHQRFKRGFTDPRIHQEFQLLQLGFPEVKYEEVGGVHWFEIPFFLLPPPLSPSQIRVAFSVTAAHPTPPPYGFFVHGEVKHGDAVITTGVAPHQPPFAGTWTFYSWTPDAWKPGTTPQNGDNLWAWARSFRNRLMEGV